MAEAPIKRYLRARPLRWGKRGSSSLLRWGKRWGTLANGARYGERMSFEESDIFFAILAYMAHIKAKFAQVGIFFEDRFPSLRNFISKKVGNRNN